QRRVERRGGRWPRRPDSNSRRESGRRASSRPLGGITAVEGANRVIERIALDGNLPSAANEAENLIERHRLRGVGAGLVIDLLAYDGALEIVHAEVERRL